LTVLSGAVSDGRLENALSRISKEKEGTEEEPVEPEHSGEPNPSVEGLRQQAVKCLVLASNSGELEEALQSSAKKEESNEAKALDSLKTRARTALFNATETGLFSSNVEAS